MPLGLVKKISLKKVKVTISLSVLILLFVPGNLIAPIIQSSNDHNDGSRLKSADFTPQDPILKPNVIRNLTVNKHWSNHIDRITKTFYYNNYLFVLSSTSGVHLVDCSDQNNPQYIRKILGNYQQPTDIAFAKDFFYISSATYGMRGINISDIDNIESLYANNLGNADHLLTKNDTLFVYGRNYQKIYLFNISSLFFPITINQIELEDTIPDFFDVDDLQVTKNTIYVLDKYNNIIHYYNATNQEAINYAGNITIAQDKELKNFIATDNLLFLSLGSNGGQVYNTSNIANVTLLNTISPVSGDSYFDALAYHQNKLFIHDKMQILVFNVTEPFNISLIGMQNSIYRIAQIAMDNSLLIANTDSSRIYLLNYTISNQLDFLSSFRFTGNKKDLIVHQKTIFLANYYSGLEILNYSNGENIEFMGNYYDGNMTFSLDYSDNLVFLTYISSPVVSFIDVSDLSSPHKVGQYCSNSSYVGFLKARQNKLYIMTEHSLEIVDISNLNSPQLLYSYSSSGLSFNGLALEGDYLYLCLSEKLVIIDISTIDNPSIIKELSLTNWSPYRIKLSSKYAFIAGTNPGLVIVDKSTPAKAKIAGTLEQSFYNYFDVCIDKGYAYLAMESGIEVYDWRNLNSFALVGSFLVPTGGYGIMIEKDLIYYPGGYTGLLIMELLGIPPTNKAGYSITVPIIALFLIAISTSIVTAKNSGKKRLICVR